MLSLIAFMVRSSQLLLAGVITAFVTSGIRR
jgi:hypothetical protein